MQLTMDWFGWLIAITIGQLTVTWILQYSKRQSRKRELRQMSQQAVANVRATEQVCLSQNIIITTTSTTTTTTTTTTVGEEEDAVYTVQQTRQLYQDNKNNKDDNNDNNKKTKLTPSQNVLNLAKRCRTYGRGKVNAITEELYDEAWTIAKTMDKESSTVDDQKPLYGIPISIKDCINQTGHYATAGLQCRTQHRSDHDSLIVQLLKQAGAIPLCRGNVPQLLMSMETNNNVWGTCSNPWDFHRTPGGSTGGDAALVAMKCVPLACGSDVAGSCRIPASFCGIVGLKPSCGRISTKGNMVPRKDNRIGSTMIIPSVIGPLGRTVDDCAAFMKAVCVPELWTRDLNVIQKTFNDKEYASTQRLKIGYFQTDDFFQPCTAAIRGLKETIAGLEKAGHQLVPFQLPCNGWETNRLLVGVNAADGNMRQYVEGLEGEDFVDQFKFLYTVANLPQFLRVVLRMCVDKRRSFLLNCAKYGGLSAYEYHELCCDIKAYRSKWSDAFVASGVDAVIYPSMPIPAVPHGMSQKLTSSATYMFIANLLLWPCGCVPVTVVGENEQEYGLEDLPHDQRDMMADVTQQVMKKSAGMPLGINIMTPMYQDEKCLRIMKEVERVVQFHHEPQAYKEERSIHKK